MVKDKKVISLNFPYLPVLINVNLNKYKVGALLDTGFDGAVILPPSLFSNGKSHKRFVNCKLADNSIIEVPVYIGSIKLGNRKLSNTVLIMGDEPIIGREVIKHFKLILDHGRKIIVEP